MPSSSASSMTSRAPTRTCWPISPPYNIDGLTDRYDESARADADDDASPARHQTWRQLCASTDRRAAAAAPSPTTAESVAADRASQPPAVAAADAVVERRRPPPPRRRRRAGGSSRRGRARACRARGAPRPPTIRSATTRTRSSERGGRSRSAAARDEARGVRRGVGAGGAGGGGARLITRRALAARIVLELLHQLAQPEEPRELQRAGPRRAGAPAPRMGASPRGPRANHPRK